MFMDFVNQKFREGSSLLRDVWGYSWGDNTVQHKAYVHAQIKNVCFPVMFFTEFWVNSSKLSFSSFLSVLVGLRMS